MSVAKYRGRFAPSPTGPLHFGSLVAAAASYLDARAHGGEWLVRMEDVDRLREVPGAADSILRTLAGFGFEWDGPIVYQSRRAALYAAALERLVRAGALYPCACTRRGIAQAAPTAPGVDGAPVYPGTCRAGLAPRRLRCAWRIKVGHAVVALDDIVQGHIEQYLATQVGDFVLKRADGLFAYQWAVVVDDAEQGVSHVVRGADLLDSTPRQIFLQRLLGVATPRYLHVPVAVNAVGEKLSKQTRAAPIEARNAAHWLRHALDFLGQPPPAALGRLDELWSWAIAHWQRRAIPRVRSLYVSPEGAREAQESR